MVNVKFFSFEVLLGDVSDVAGCIQPEQAALVQVCTCTYKHLTLCIVGAQGFLNTYAPRVEKLGLISNLHPT